MTKSEKEELVCQLTKLTPGNKYSVEVLECMLSESSCERLAYAIAWTMPLRMLSIFLCSALTTSYSYKSPVKCDLLHCLYTLHILAPKEVTLNVIDERKVAVWIVSPDENAAIIRFDARVKNGTEKQRCSAMVSSGPVECELDHLSRGSFYAIEVVACVPGVCSQSADATISIPPSRTFIFYTKYKCCS